MGKRFEKTYGRAMKGIFFAVNPLKKKVIKTYCTVHRFINIRAVEILRNEGYKEEYLFFKEHIGVINKGVTWADQDFKSSNHFYHYKKGIGLFGFSNALIEFRNYYRKALTCVRGRNMEKGLFYFGAACHLVQDTTVPQHVNNKLLDSHRKFELWIIEKFLSDYSFYAESGIIRFKSNEDYIKKNAKVANNVYMKYSEINDTEKKYYLTAQEILKQAQRTTAGLMADFYEEIKKIS